jgi:hypothetical protein
MTMVVKFTAWRSLSWYVLSESLSRMYLVLNVLPSDIVNVHWKCALSIALDAALPIMVFYSTILI